MHLRQKDQFHLYEPDEIDPLLFCFVHGQAPVLSQGISFMNSRAPQFLHTSSSICFDYLSACIG